MIGEEFLPAASLSEAVSRIEGLTGAAPEATRGEKRALLVLRDALGLDVPTVSTNAVLGAAIAEELGVTWHPSLYVDRTMLTLRGVNALLHGAYRASRSGVLRRLDRTTSRGLEGPEWAAFSPAASKIEAVTRISALTDSGPEWLGPGSKEHKRVLVNLATRMLPALPIEGLSKTQLGGAIAAELGVPWGDEFISTGETIRLSGLNVILAGAERRMGMLGRAYASGLSPEDEGAALVEALWQKAHRAGRAPWDGRAATLWLRDEGTRQENQMEWPGFYFEFLGRTILSDAFRPNPSPPPVRYANTVFDYSLNHVWDLKAHTAEQFFPASGDLRSVGDEVQLNDADAVRRCVTEQGLGFLILSGGGVMDEDGAFKAWHDAFKGKPATPSLGGGSRMRKAAFRPLVIEAFWIPDLAALDDAVAAGAMKAVAQGRQQSGAPRPDKFHMRLSRARRMLRVAAREW